MACSFCGGVKQKMTIQWNSGTGELLMLCFHGCQHFPEPYRDTEAGSNGLWHRIDPWQDYIRRQPKLQKNMKIVGKPSVQTTL